MSAVAKLRGKLPAALLLGLLALASPARADDAAVVTPLVIGDSVLLHSTVLGEDRRINVYAPPGYASPDAPPLPVLYMPDGGLAEDFLHVAGLVQVGAGNGTMRPFLLVGIENTERRRDMLSATEVPEERKIAPHAGGSAAFRRFIRTELMPYIRAHYRTTSETAVVGESFAGLFIVQTFLVEPELFDTYIAFDASLWWNRKRILRDAPQLLSQQHRSGKRLFLAASPEDIDAGNAQLEGILARTPGIDFQHVYLPMPQERHATIFHPAALLAFRQMLAPAAQKAR